MCRAEINQRVSDRLKEQKRARTAELICSYCHKNFVVGWNRRSQQYCSRSCASISVNSRFIVRKNHSERMTQRILDGSGWVLGGGRRVKFNWLGIEINCDSVIEWCGLQLIIQMFDVKNIIRNPVRIPYIDNDQMRVFVPDFRIDTHDNRSLIMECKSRQHPKRDGCEIWKNYQRLVPAKKSALQKYCENNGLLWAWFDEHVDHAAYVLACKYHKMISRQSLTG